MTMTATDRFLTELTDDPDHADVFYADLLDRTDETEASDR